MLALIGYSGRSSSSQQHGNANHVSTHCLARALSALFAVFIALFWLCTGGVASRVVDYDWLAMTYLVALVAVFFAPLADFPSTGRHRFLTTLRRVAMGRIAKAPDTKFGDVLLSDVLTSYAKVLGDIFVVLCMFFSSGGSSTRRPDRNCGGTVMVPLLMAVPSLIRFSQCMTEWWRIYGAGPPWKESTGWGGQHLANALKYSTAFPVLITSTLQRNTEDAAAKATYNKAWLVAVLINSLYSFYWDVAKDWDMTLFSSKTIPWQRVFSRDFPPRRVHHLSPHAWGLRVDLKFRPVTVYYAVIVLDLLLRCTWSMKLSPHLDKFSDFETGIFLIELLEVFRRWVWIFLRVETERLRRPSMVLGMDDTLLGDYQGQSDDDIEDV